MPLRCKGFLLCLFIDFVIIHRVGDELGTELLFWADFEVHSLYTSREVNIAFKAAVFAETCSLQRNTEIPYH